MIPQQIQMQQIQIQQSNHGLQGAQNTQYVSQQDQQQQLHNQILQSQQMALQQQQAQNGVVTSQANNVKQILVGQQNMASGQGTLVSIGANSPLNTIQTLNSPITSTPHLTLQPPPNPLAAMTTLSYNGPSFQSTQINKDDKHTAGKTDEKHNEQVSQSTVESSIATSNATTIVVSSNINLSAPSNAMKDKVPGKCLCPLKNK